MTRAALLGMARLPLLRVVRGRRFRVLAFAWIGLAVAIAFVARANGSVSGADHVLRGPFGALVVPLLTYAVVSGALGGAGFRVGLRGLVAVGASPRRAALASLLSAAAISAALSAIVAAIICVVAHGVADAPLAIDLVTSALVAALSGAVYAAYFAAGSAIGRGAMRGGFLVLDWLFGGGSGFGAIFTPRGHVASLLGGELCFDLSRRTSSVLLVLLGLFYAGLALRLSSRIPRAK